MKFTSFLKLLAYSLVSIPWMCREFWVIGLLLASMCFIGDAPARRQVACAVGAFALFILITCLTACQSLIANDKATDDDAEKMWRSLFKRRSK